MWTVFRPGPGYRSVQVPETQAVVVLTRLRGTFGLVPRGTTGVEVSFRPCSTWNAPSSSRRRSNPPSKRAAEKGGRAVPRGSSRRPGISGPAVGSECTLVFYSIYWYKETSFRASELRCGSARTGTGARCGWVAIFLLYLLIDLAPAVVAAGAGTGHPGQGGEAARDDRQRRKARGNGAAGMLSARSLSRDPRSPRRSQIGQKLIVRRRPAINESGTESRPPGCWIY